MEDPGESSALSWQLSPAGRAAGGGCRGVRLRVATKPAHVLSSADRTSFDQRSPVLTVTYREKSFLPVKRTDEIHTLNTIL
jgi:hypothetical protein